MSIAVEAEIARRRGARTEHPPKWGCEEGATTSPGYFCFNPFGLRIFLFEASSIVGHRSMADMLPPHSSPQTKISLSGDAHSFSTACKQASNAKRSTLHRILSELPLFIPIRLPSGLRPGYSHTQTRRPGNRQGHPDDTGHGRASAYMNILHLDRPALPSTYQPLLHQDRPRRSHRVCLEYSENGR